MLRDKLDKVFSLYIRRRDEAKGCISCGQAIRSAYCDAGHYIPRSHTATRWNVYNVNAQCYHCNRILDGNIENYRKGLIRRYGINVVEELERLRNTTYKPTKTEIENFIQKLKNILR